MVATVVFGRLRLKVTTVVTGHLRLTFTSVVSGRPNPEVNKRHSNPDFEPITYFRDLSAEMMTSSMFRLWFMKLLFTSGRIFHAKIIFYAQHDVASWPVPPLRSSEFGSVWGHFRVCEAEFPFWILFVYKLRTTSGTRGLLIAAVKMDSDSDYEPFDGFSTADILDTSRDIEELSDSDSDSDDNVDLFGSDSDDDQVSVWTDVLEDVNPLHFVNQWVRGTVLQKMLRLFIFFHLVIEPVFLLGGFAGNQYSKQRQEQLQRLDTRGFPNQCRWDLGIYWDEHFNGSALHARLNCVLVNGWSSSCRWYSENNAKHRYKKTVSAFGRQRKSLST